MSNLFLKTGFLAQCDQLLLERQGVKKRQDNRFIFTANCISKLPQET
ncbi:hypothetical protein AVDCRST_MAG92-3980 [uncultured Coleofasciculus sp.]|uniref:Uncharacterized protein n=1 Tax=uncultured Coleofasciculus sp. TaxID=1267456 RepID=A0A6J4JSZ9_9CYAN|nr:hypothetical protein AVDCRST_MAG92-3980 [uncultured Coleofasciculus sp.]